MGNRELSIWDMFWSICLKWRVIIVSMIAFAVLLGGFSYYKSYMVVQEEKQKQTETSYEDLELTDEEKYYAESYLGYKAVYDKQMSYNAESELMKLDADEFYLLPLTYYIDNDYVVEYPQINKFNNADSIAYAYKAKVVEAGLGELVDCNNEYGNLEDEENGTFVISIYGTSPEVCNALSGQVQKVIEDSHADVCKQVGNHSIAVITETCALTSSIEMLDFQKMSADKLNAYGKLVFDTQAKMTSKAKLYIELYEQQNTCGDSMDEMADVTTNNLKVTVSKKYVVLGTIIGIVIAVCFYALSYILNSKILFEDNFEKLYGIHVIGKIKSEEKKKWCSNVDGFIERMRNVNMVQLTKEESFDMLISALKHQVRKDDLKELVLSGKLYTDAHKELIERVKIALEEKNVNVVYTDSILYDSQALTKNAEAKTIVLLECAGYTKYEWVKQEIENNRFGGVEILGAVIIK